MPALISAKAAAEYLGVASKTLLRLAEGGHVPSFKDPDTGWRRYSVPALDRWLADNCPSQDEVSA